MGRIDVSIAVVLTDLRQPAPLAKAIEFTFKTYEINAPGTAYQLDDFPIPFRTALASPYPSDFDVLTAFERRTLERTNSAAQSRRP